MVHLFDMYNVQIKIISNAYDVSGYLEYWRIILRISAFIPFY